MTRRRAVWTAVRVLLALAVVASLGFMAFVPALVGAVVDSRRAGRLALWAATALIAAVTFTGGSLLTSVADADEDRVARDDVGFGLVLLGGAAGVAAAFAFRPRPSVAERFDEDHELPGVEGALEAREKRRRFQELAARDPALAAELGVGRPDRRDPLDDGGLLDLNALDAPALRRHAGLSEPQARCVVEVRERLGRLSSVDELVVHGTLDLATAERLRERAVFRP